MLYNLSHQEMLSLQKKIESDVFLRVQNNFVIIIVTCI